MDRVLVPGALRHVELEEGPGPTSPGLAGLQAGILSSAVAAQFGPVLPAFVGPAAFAVVAGVVAAANRGRWGKMPPTPIAFRVVPWGVIIDPGRGGRAYAWSELAALEHEHVMNHGRRWWHKGQVALSHLRWVAAGRRYVGETAYDHGLASLGVDFARYAEESRRPIALGLEADSSSVDPSAPGAFAEVRENARRFLAVGEGRAFRSIQLASYRDRQSGVSEEARHALRRAIECHPERCDPGPYAAVLAVELGHAAAVGSLVAHILSPNPLVAAVFKAAARRLGASPMQSGKIDEVRPFVSEAALGELEAWSRGEL